MGNSHGLSFSSFVCCVDYTTLLLSYWRVGFFSCPHHLICECKMVCYDSHDITAQC